MRLRDDQRGIVIPVFFVVGIAIIVLLILASALLSLFLPIIISIIGALLFVAGLLGLLGIKGTIFDVITLGIKLDQQTAGILMGVGIVMILFSGFISDATFSIIGPLAITGALEGGDTASTSQTTYAPGGHKLVLTSNTIIEPGESFTGTLFANGYGIINNPPMAQLFIEKGSGTGLIKHNIISPLNEGWNIDNPPKSFSASSFSTEKGKYQLRLRDFGIPTNQGDPNSGQTPLESNFTPTVNMWVVDERCALPENFAIVNESFIAGQSFNIDSFSFNVETFCYNYFIRKHMSGGVVEKSVLEYDILERGETISVPLDEIWEITYFADRQQVGVPESCTPDKVIDAETGSCTVDISLIHTCKGQVNFFTNTCVETGAPNCPIGQLEIIKADGSGECAFSQQVTFDDSGNKFTCGLASILNEDTNLCETPSSLSPILCTSSEIDSVTGICEREPRVECAVSDNVWSHELSSCIVLPNSQLSCSEAGFAWNTSFSFCSSTEVQVSGNLEEDCGLIGGQFTDGVCVVHEILPGVVLSTENILLFSLIGVIVVAGGFILFKRIGG